MSNRSSRKPNPALQNIGKAIGEAARKAREEREAQELSEPEEHAPKGILPIPAEQLVFDDRYEWVWEALPEEIHVYAAMERAGETWSVRLNTVDQSMQLTADESKTLGECLLAAYNYQYIWKNGFADLFDKKADLKPLYTDKDKRPAKIPVKKRTPKGQGAVKNPEGEPDTSFDNG